MFGKNISYRNGRGYILEIPSTTLRTGLLTRPQSSTNTSGLGEHPFCSNDTNSSLRARPRPRVNLCGQHFANLTRLSCFFGKRKGAMFLHFPGGAQKRTNCYAAKSATNADPLDTDGREIGQAQLNPL